MIWIVFALMTGAAAMSVLWPLARARARKASVEASDVAFYEGQIAEIARDGARGLIAPSDMEAVRSDAARRLLQADRNETGRPLHHNPRAALGAAIFAVVLIPVVAMGLYGRIGHPEWPDEPLVARMTAPPEDVDLAAALARIEMHLAQSPDDGRGFDIVAPVYLKLGRAADAIHAYEAAIRLLGETPARRAGWAEAKVVEANGTVTAEARAAFEDIARTAPDVAAAPFYLGVAARQRGDTAEARRIWSAMLASAPADAPWAETVRAQLAALDPSARPSGQDAGTQAAIRGMVAGLAARLAADGGDGEGWLRLVRSYMVLGEPDKASEALGKARQAMTGRTDILARLDALASEFGIRG